jgi:hypothetical protein
VRRSDDEGAMASSVRALASSLDLELPAGVCLCLVWCVTCIAGRHVSDVAARL